MRHRSILNEKQTLLLVAVGVLVVKAIMESNKRKKEEQAETIDIGYAVEVEQKQLPSAETH